MKLQRIVKDILSAESMAHMWFTVSFLGLPRVTQDGFLVEILWNVCRVLGRLWGLWGSWATPSIFVLQFPFLNHLYKKFYRKSPCVLVD